MKKEFALSVPSPCQERWERFKPTPEGGYCGSCQKVVIDFTSWSDDEIKNYFRQQRRTTCGRFRTHQLKVYREPSTARGWIPSLVAFVLLLLSRPVEAQPPTKVSTEQLDKREDHVVVGDTLALGMTVRGVVVDANDGSFIPGVNVVEYGTTNSSVTDGEGKFSMRVGEAGDSVRLIFSFIGYKTAERVLPRVSLYDTEVRLTMDVDVLGGITLGGVVALPWYSPRRWWWKVRSLFR